MLLVSFCRISTTTTTILPSRPLHENHRETIEIETLHLLQQSRVLLLLASVLLEISSCADVRSVREEHDKSHSQFAREQQPGRSRLHPLKAILRARRPATAERELEAMMKARFNLRASLTQAVLATALLLSMTPIVTSSSSVTVVSTTGGGSLSSLVAPSSNMTSSRSRVMVHIPFSLHNASGEEHEQAHFGFDGSSSSLSLFVYALNNHTLCEPLHWHNGTNGTSPSTSTDHQKGPFILMALSGDCSPVTKARHAQQAGAAALVVADTTCRCTNDKACTDQFGPDCNDDPRLLVNDGSAADVSIPTFLLYKLTAHKIMEQLHDKDQPVLMELAWGLPLEPIDGSNTTTTPSNNRHPPIHYHLWTTAHDPILDLETYRNLRTVAVAFSNHTHSNKTSRPHFAPRLSIIPGQRFHCDTTVGPCDHLCSNHGRYCAVHARNLSGFAIVRETLHRMCIWQVLTQPPSNSSSSSGAHHNVATTTTTHTQQYWDYWLYHLEHCSAPHQYGNADCLSKARAHAQLDKAAVTACLDEHSLETDAPNALLEQALLWQEQSGVVRLPALTVDRMVVQPVSSWHLFLKICESYWAADRPDAPILCYQCATCSNVIGCVKAGGKCVPFHPPSDDDDDDDDDHKKKNDDKKSGSSKHKTHHVRNFFVFLLLVLMGYGGWYYYQHYYQQHNHGARGGILNGYLQLQGEG